MTTEKQQHNLAIVGGGISGLSAAYYAILQGQDPKTITVYEASQRLGGKILSGQLEDVVVNRGAEFVDTSNEKIIALCRDLGVELKKSEDQQTERFQLPNGHIISGEAFHAAFAPITEQILRDKQEVLANPDGAKAQRINQLSLEAYLRELQQNIPARRDRNVFEILWDVITFKNNRVSDAIIEAVGGAFGSEVGQKPANTSAMQFVHEFGDHEGLLSSDCGFRVVGGTEKIIEALHQKLQAQGVNFQYQEKMVGVSNHGDGLSLRFANGNEAQHSKVILAVPSYDLAEIQGLEALGMAPHVRTFLAQAQYTNSVKFTIKLQPGIQAPNATTFSASGYQFWSSDPGYITFLCQADMLPQMGASQMVQHYLDLCAKTFGKPASEVFDTQKIMFTNPGSKQCYASPAPGQAMMFEQLAHACDAMSQHGIAISGTFFPLREENSISMGFMECGAHASEMAVQALLEKPQYKQQWLEQILDRQQPKLSHEQAVQDNASISSVPAMA